MSDSNLTDQYNRSGNAEVPKSSPIEPELDIGKYRSDLTDLCLTAEQEAELLMTLWSIMRSFVEMGFTINICEQLFHNFNEAAGADSGDDKISPSSTMETTTDDGGKEPTP